MISFIYLALEFGMILSCRGHSTVLATTFWHYWRVLIPVTRYLDKGCCIQYGLMSRYNFPVEVCMMFQFMTMTSATKQQLCPTTRLHPSRAEADRFPLLIIPVIAIIQKFTFNHRLSNCIYFLRICIAVDHNESLCNL